MNDDLWVEGSGLAAASDAQRVELNITCFHLAVFCYTPRAKFTGAKFRRMFYSCHSMQGLELVYSPPECSAP